MFLRNVNLLNHSHYRIGGSADYFYVGRNIEEIIRAVEIWRRFGGSNPDSGKIFILGKGTNVLFGDSVFDGLVIKPEIRFIKKEEFFLKVGAGITMGELVDYSADKGLSGLEWAAGLPGTLGGAIRGNAGAFGGEIKDVVYDVVSVDISGRFPKILRRSNNNCFFDYRVSVFKKNREEIIVDAILKLKKRNRFLIRNEIEEKINYRLKKHPMEHPSLGSTFKNVAVSDLNERQLKIMSGISAPVKNGRIPASYLISTAGLAGVSCGGAMISPKHANFIVNVLNASSSDVKNLIDLAKKEVGGRFGVDLKEEIECLI